jgi:ankyrin repeat protein
MAARDGNKERVKLLLTIGSNVNAVTNDGWTALQLAIRNGSIELVKLLLEKNDNLNEDDVAKACTLAASYKNKKEILKLLKQVQQGMRW